MKSPEINSLNLFTYDHYEIVRQQTITFRTKANKKYYLFNLFVYIGYNQNRIIRPRTGTEPELLFFLTRARKVFKISGSGL